MKETEQEAEVMFASYIRQNVDITEGEANMSWVLPLEPIPQAAS